jgi:hypothetical protein
MVARSRNESRFWHTFLMLSFVAATAPDPDRQANNSGNPQCHADYNSSNLAGAHTAATSRALAQGGIGRCGGSRRDDDRANFSCDGRDTGINLGGSRGRRWIGRRGWRRSRCRGRLLTLAVERRLRRGRGMGERAKRGAGLVQRSSLSP